MSVTEAAFAVAEEFTIQPIYPPHQGRCYEMAAKRVCYGETTGTMHLSGYEGSTLVHGTFESGYGDMPPLFHAWVVESDGSVYEPTTNHVYTARAFEAMFNPTVIVTYSPAEARAISHERYHFGPWTREAWEGEGFEEANGEWE